MMLLHFCASGVQDTLMSEEETQGRAVKLVVKDSLTRHLADRFSHSTRRISNLWSVSRCFVKETLSTSAGWMFLGGRHLSAEVAGASIHFCHGTRALHLCSPGCFLGHLRPISAQGCNLDWQWIAYNQPKKLFWTDQWGDLWVKPDEFTDWGKA